MREAQLLLLLGAVFVGSFLILWMVEAASSYRRYRGKRLIICPETKTSEEVRVAAGRAAVSVLAGPDLHLNDCTRWPERAGCGQECLSQIEDAPDGCLVTGIVAHWYEGKSCTYCHRPFQHIEWHDHRPALLDEEGRTVQWHEIPARTLPDVMRSHKPVCWECHIHESFRREHPELVTDRTGTHG